MRGEGLGRCVLLEEVSIPGSNGYSDTLRTVAEVEVFVGVGEREKLLKG